MTSPQPTGINQALSQAKLTEALQAQQADPTNAQKRRAVAYWLNQLPEDQRRAYQHTN